VSRDPRRALHREKRDWDRLATLDARWAILSDRRHKFGRWSLPDFFAEGAQDVERFLAIAHELGLPKQHGTVLDFGCGIGRLAPGLLTAFRSYCGLDLSAEMVARATQLHETGPTCQFRVNQDSTLEQIPEDSFDLIVSLYVLQHCTVRSEALSILRGLLRTLRPGGLIIVQIPDRIPAPEKFFYDTRRGLFTALARLRVPQSFAFRHLGLFPMTLNYLSEDEVTNAIQASGGEIVRVDRGRVGIAVRDRTYFATRDAGASSP